jgi:hypothetical protein
MRKLQSSSDLTSDEQALVHELRELLDSNGEESFSKHTLTSIGLIAQKKAVSHDKLDDLDTLQTVMATLSKLSETERVALAQHKTILRGIFSGRQYYIM